MSHYGSQIKTQLKQDWFTQFWSQKKQVLNLENFKYSTSDELL